MLFYTQKTTVRPVQAHHSFWLGARWSRCQVGIGLFFNPSQGSLVADAKGSGEPPGRAAFLACLDDQFFELLAFTNRLEDPAKTTCLAFVFGVSRTVRTIFDDVLGTAFATALMFCYHDKKI